MTTIQKQYRAQINRMHDKEEEVLRAGHKPVDMRAAYTVLDFLEAIQNGEFWLTLRHDGGLQLEVGEVEVCFQPNGAMLKHEVPEASDAR